MKKPTIVAQIIAIAADDADDVDKSDPFRPSGPYGIAQSCAAEIARLEAERDKIPRSDRKEINKRLSLLRSTKRWCETRQGYVEPVPCTSTNGGICIAPTADPETKGVY